MRVLLVTLLAFPLAGALLQAGLCRRLSRQASAALAAAAMAGALVAAVAAVWNLPGAPVAVSLGDWLALDGLTVRFSFLFDRVAGLMAVTVTFVALCIHLYSATYMRHDAHFTRYFCYLNLFVFFMLVIVTADDLVFLFLGWEGVGFCSYALIGFWHGTLANVDAGRKAFLMTRLGDLGFVAALALLVPLAGQASLTDLAARAATLSPGLAAAIGFCFLFAAIGKSAQLPLATWLPDAMAGPTPVSALIHAATMVTAGVYLLVRLAPLLPFAPDVGAAAAAIGALTALFGAACALAQRDVKRILAYSTISQVGYMFLAVGGGDTFGALFHLQTHAFFKSLLFMTAGIMIQASNEEHDIFRMGAGLRRSVPGLLPLFACGAAALAGLPLTAGFASKGHILATALGHPGPVFLACFVVGMVTALLTALYVFRLLFVAFFAAPADPARPTPSPATARMRWPLVPLALLAVGYGLADPPGFLHLGHGLGAWLAGGPAPARPDAQLLAPYVEGLDAAVALIGLWLAWAIYAPARAPRPAPANPFTRGLGLDAFYLRRLAAPCFRLARFLWKRIDADVLDGVPMALGAGLLGLSGNLRRLTSGRVSVSLTLLAATTAACLAWLALAWP